MARTRSPYKRVPGRRTGLFRRDSLWLGPDHLLSVHSWRFTEEYRRFYLADIQALVVQKRPRGSTLLRDVVVLSVLVALAAAPALTGHPVWASLAGILLLGYVLWAWRRSDCKTWVQTAVGVEELPSLRRSRTAGKALALLDLKVRAAQPEMAAEDLARAIEEPPPLPLVQDARAGPLPPPLPAASAAREPSRLYLLAYIVLLALGTVKIFATLTPAKAFYWMLPAGYFVFLALLMVPLFRQGLDPIRGSRAWSVFSSLGIAGTLGATSLRWAVSQNLMTMQNPDLQRIYSGVDQSKPLHLALAFLLLALAVWGLMVFGFMREERAAGVRGPLSLFGADRP